MPHMRFPIMFLTLLLWLSSAHATGYGKIEFSAKLVGWSDDGKCFAVIKRGVETHDGDTASFRVACDGREGLWFRTDDEPENESNAPLVLHRKGSPKYPALERVNVETDPILTEFHLKAPKSSWRRSFEDHYSVKTRKRCDGKRYETCTWRFRIFRDGKRVGEITKEGDGNEHFEFRGGFAHPQGKRILVKIRYVGNGLYGTTEAYDLIRVAK